ncbi:ATP-binding protein [Streptomyces sp. NPDC093510]|uniref:ATP-binding protein n=1 Tax=Streptomyces sp. NPDC093510 TaxID=3155199 RepID=UPI0034411DE4
MADGFEALGGSLGRGMAARYADHVAVVQLGLARRLLERARLVLDGSGATEPELAPLAAQLACALGDTLLIAESRGPDFAGPSPAPHRAVSRTAPQSLSMRRLPGADLLSAPTARRHVRDTARSWRLPQGQVETLEVITSELVTNALTHGGGETVTVVLALVDRAVTVSVTDEGRGVVRAMEEDLLEADVPEDGEPESGRGLLIVSGLADRWGQYRGPDGLTVWAEAEGRGGDACPWSLVTLPSAHRPGTVKSTS